VQDIIRMESYRTAILQNKKCFEGKAVLDVGTGSGVLAIWAAMAGARVVYAVEATSMAKQARRLAEANGVGHIVQVFEGYMEQVRGANAGLASLAADHHVPRYLPRNHLLSSPSPHPRREPAPSLPLALDRPRR